MASHLRLVRGLLPVLARTVTTIGNAGAHEFFDDFARSLRLYLVVTAASGTGGLNVIIRGYDKYGNFVNLSTGGTAVTANGTYVYEMALAVAAATGNVHEAVSRQAPVKWDVQVVHADASSYTYALSAEVN